MSENKYAALIQIGYFKNCFEADSPTGIIRKAESIQDFDCIVRMGRMAEGKKGQKELDKLEAFLIKYHDGDLTMEDIQNLDVNLSIGSITCYAIAETDADIERLKAL